VDKPAGSGNSPIEFPPPLTPPTIANPSPGTTPIEPSKPAIPVPVQPAPNTTVNPPVAPTPTPPVPSNSQPPRPLSPAVQTADSPPQPPATPPSASAGTTPPGTAGSKVTPVVPQKPAPAILIIEVPPAGHALDRRSADEPNRFGAKFPVAAFATRQDLPVQNPSFLAGTQRTADYHGT
jgi:hypothetical protein